MDVDGREVDVDGREKDVNGCEVDVNSKRASRTQHGVFEGPESKLKVYEDGRFIDRLNITDFKKKINRYLSVDGKG